MTTQITVRQAAGHFNVSETTIRRWIKTGKLQADSVDGRYLINVDVESSESSESSVSEPATDDVELVEYLKAHVVYLRQQLELKDEQLSHMQQMLGDALATIEGMTQQNHELIRQNQQLLTDRYRLLRGMDYLID